MITQNRTIQLAQIPLGGMGGAAWNRLHSEREDICEALVKRCEPASKQLLQARLRKLDDELDRLMPGARRAFHVRVVELVPRVAHLVVVRVTAVRVGRERLPHDALVDEGDVVGAREEVLIGIRIGLHRQSGRA